MIRSIVVMIITLSTFLVLGANYKTLAPEQIKRNCKGYSVIEVDKGIDCNGDTIKLMKVNGFFERASAHHLQ